MIAATAALARRSVALLVFDALGRFRRYAGAGAGHAGRPSLAAVVSSSACDLCPAMRAWWRAQTMSLKSAEFVLAARAPRRARPWRILPVHIMPNLIGPLLILASMDIPVVITIEAGMSFSD
jgi:peptide/nickel transport system permease protein